jgi:hypothetical protein
MVLTPLMPVGLLRWFALSIQQGNNFVMAITLFADFENGYQPRQMHQTGPFCRGKSHANAVVRPGHPYSLCELVHIRLGPVVRGALGIAKSHLEGHRHVQFDRAYGQHQAANRGFPSRHAEHRRWAQSGSNFYRAADRPVYYIRIARERCSVEAIAE